MSDFSIEINENNTQIEVESSIINTLELNSTNLLLETENSEQGVNYTLEIEQASSATLFVNTEYTGTVVFAGDVIGLDTFIANFIDDYEIDCGSP
jgi:hypothetical protein